MLLSEIWNLYRKDKFLEGYSIQTLKAYELQVKLLIRYVGDTDISLLSFEMLKGYFYSIGETLKPSSIGHRIRFIKSFCRYAHEEGHIRQNPATKLKEPKSGKRIPKFLTKKEIEHLREACNTPLENSLFEFIYSTGCRIGEVVNIKKNDLNWSNCSVIVRGKGDKEREVYFNIRCEIWLGRYIDGRSDLDEHLFVTERTPHKMSISQMRYIIKRISSRAGIQKSVHPHQLRHSYATHLMENGAPLEVIQSLLGHEKSETTRLYAQFSGKIRKELYCKYF